MKYAIGYLALGVLVVFIHWMLGAAGAFRDGWRQAAKARRLAG